jgi:phenylalanyl-tRNA synthetase beta chain
VTLTGIKVAESPTWLQARLRTIGVKPINNVVDVTNFVLHEMGQPLHAFDADQINGQKIIVKTLAAGTPFMTLDKVERKLDAQDLMICDGDSKGMCIAGVYGGIGTGITTASTSVFLESAHFHPQWIRRTGMRHDLRTDAARTFEKSTDPAICREALIRAARMILELAGGEVASEIVDCYPNPIERPEVVLRWEMIPRLIGADIPRDEILNILKALDMTVLSSDGATITVSVPTNKADVLREADVIEEILRIYGYNNVGLKPRLEISLNTAQTLTISTLRDDLSNFLAARGFIEIMGLSFVESRQYESGPLQISSENRVLIENTSNAHLDLMRHNLLASAIEAVRFNQNRMQTDLLLFEFGRTYEKINNTPTETERLALIASGLPVAQGWRQKSMVADFFALKQYVHLILDYLGIHDFVKVQAQGEQWEFGLRYESADNEICTFGSISKAIVGQYDLKQAFFYADFNVQALLTLVRDQVVEVRDVSKYPAVHRDIAIILPVDIPYDQVQQAIARAGGTLLIDYDLFDIYENADAVGEGKRSMAISLIFQDSSRTLTDTDISKAVLKIVEALKVRVDAVLR